MAAAGPRRANGSCGVAGGGGGRDLGAVAAQRRGQDVDGGLGVGGFGGDDAVRVGFGGGQIDVVFDASAGQGDVKQLAGEGCRRRRCGRRARR